MLNFVFVKNRKYAMIEPIKQQDREETESGTISLQYRVRKRMKKRIAAIGLGIFLLALPILQPLAAEVVLDFDTAETGFWTEYESEIETEALTDVFETQNTETVESEWTEMILSIEEVDNFEAETEVFTDTAEGIVSESGQSIDARDSMLRMYAAASFDDCYGNQLDSTAREVYNAMVKWYVQDQKTGELEIALSPKVTFQTEGTLNGSGGLNWNRADNEEYQQKITYSMQAAYDAFVYDHPEIFWMDKFSYRTSITFKGGAGIYTGTVNTITLIPSELYDGAAAEVSQFEQAVSNVCVQLGLGNNHSKYEIVQTIHDYLCQTLTYGERDECAHSAAGVFLREGIVVCEGYAKAFKVLCNRFNVASILIVGNANEPHMWNYVQMEDGNWYLVDVTWDDSGSDIDTTYLLVGSGTLGYKNLPIAQERYVYTNFSSAAYTMHFNVPVLSETAYQPGAIHTHIWQIEEQKEATCQSEGYQIYRCDICSAVSKVRTDGVVGHSFVNYQSNRDARFSADGTKTAWCEYGCGTSKTVTDSNTRVRTQVTSLTLQKGQKLAAIQVIGLPAGVKIKSWKSSNTKILAVSKNGKLTAGSKTGTAKLTVTIGNDSWSDSKAITVKVQNKAVKTTKVTVSQKSVTLQKGKKHQIVATVTPLGGSKPTYATSDKKVAVVSKNGLVTAKGAGTAKITVKSGTKKCTVTIKVPQVKTTKLKNIPQKTITLKKGKTKQLNIKTYPANSDQKIYYRSSDKKLVSVSSKGKLTAKKVGTVTITVKSGSVIEKFKVKVKK